MSFLSDLSSNVINAPMPKAWTAQDLIHLAESNFGAVVTKSITLQPRQGNLNSAGKPENREYYADNYSLNAVGLANDGIDQHIQYVQQAKSKYPQKPFIINIAGFSVDEYAQMMKKIQHEDSISAVELNVSCPNTDKRIFVENPPLIDQILKNIAPFRSKPLGIKVNPSDNNSLIQDLVAVFVSHNIDFITCTNTLGNCFSYKIDGTPALDVNNGFGGMGGRSLKPYSLSTLIRYKAKLEQKQSSIDLIGVGGVETMQDVQDYLRAGATVVGVATAYMTQKLDI